MKTIRRGSTEWGEAINTAFSDWKEWLQVGICVHPDARCVWEYGAEAYIAGWTVQE